MIILRSRPGSARLLSLVMLAVLALLTSTAEAAQSLTLLDLGDPGAAAKLLPSSSQVTVAADAAGPALVITVEPGKENYPGVTLPAKPLAAWDLSGFGHVAATVTNTGSKATSVNLRVDNAPNGQGNPWNTESIYLKPGASGRVVVRFGYSFNKPGFPLKSSAVTKLLLFTGKSDVTQSIRLESLVASGQPGEAPPVNPASIRVKPVRGLLFPTEAAFDPATQLTLRHGASGEVVSHAGKPALRVQLPGNAKEPPSLVIKPPAGRWDLRDAAQVTVTLRNEGTQAVLPRLRVDSNGGLSDLIVPDAPLGPGQSITCTIPFTSRTLWDGEKHKETGNRLTSDAVSGVVISVDKGQPSAELLVTHIVASTPEARLPDWLGKRPPVEGDWAPTFVDEFDGSVLDDSRWSVTGENYWDKKSHFSKANTIIGGGVVRLRFEKKPGKQNDDPNHKWSSDYATGYLDTFGKWTQRYGYFEARVKPPTAPGLWPAFWMMPDRGGDGPQWKRQYTGDSAMEFDIYEALTRWGPRRYNIAMHWDGYDKNHKHIGSDKVYALPDAEGFIVVGLLWTPGSVVFYANGQPVGQWDNPRISSVPSTLMFTLPCGGWDNNAVEDATLPADFVIDYVRCWQRKDLLNSAAPAPASIVK
jgi:beta-glucanase (GH16 family)